MVTSRASVFRRSRPRVGPHPRKLHCELPPARAPPPARPIGSAFRRRPAPTAPDARPGRSVADEIAATHGREDRRRKPGSAATQATVRPARAVSWSLATVMSRERSACAIFAFAPPTPPTPVVSPPAQPPWWRP